MPGVPHCNSRKITAPGTACQSAAGVLPSPAAGEILTLCKLVNGWD